MTTTQNPLPPEMQAFMQAGDAMARGFMDYMSQQKDFVFSGQSAAGAPAGSAEVPAPDLAALHELQERYRDLHGKLWTSMLAAQDGSGAAEARFRVEADPGDRRFAAAEWRASPIYDYVQQAYLINARFVGELAATLPIADKKAAERVRFLARQFADAMAPSNFAATNPEFIRIALETKGKSISDGITNLVEDLHKGRITTTDETVFEIGRNLATTPGSVVFENEVMQLIQYAPTTAEVAVRPLLIVPPCINKFYILDLQPENSLVRFAVAQGHTVFLVSWRNVKAEQGHLSWDDYVEKGAIQAVATVRDICDVSEINALGFCVGGTILSSALAVLKARGQDGSGLADAVKSLTLLTTLLDFSDAGEIGLFIDADQLKAREETIGKGGLLAGRELANTFSSLRANDLVWNYVANNYLKGRKPAAFDLLYWNSDSTNLPGPFACWYMRNLYLDNALREPGKLEMAGVRVDLGKLDMPAYILATREDHIVPWHSAYQSVRLLGGDKRFVLGASGHIAGVINPASKNKRSYWLGGNQKDDAKTWLAGAEEKPGSWWNDWAAWLDGHAGGRRAAPKAPGNARWRPIEPAPGSYVKQRS